MYEERWSVQADALGVKSIHPSGESTMLPWDKIRGIVIQTNDSGPVGADVWWFAAGDDGSVAFPMGATGEKDALAFFQSLPGFNNKELIKAMQSTTEATFLLWENPATDKPDKSA